MKCDFFTPDTCGGFGTVPRGHACEKSHLGMPGKYLLNDKHALIFSEVILARTARGRLSAELIAFVLFIFDILVSNTPVSARFFKASGGIFLDIYSLNQSGVLQCVLY